MSLDASVLRRWIQAGLVAGLIVIALSLVLPAIQQAREAARRTQSRNNLRQFGLALHNYHEAINCYPPGGTFDATGRGHHGWFVLLSPYIDASPLYSKVDKSEPWDSPHNAALFRFKPAITLNPSILDDTPEHEFGVIHYSANSHLMAANSSVTLSDIDDKENSFIAGELGGDFVPWACPYNWRPLATLTGAPRTYGRPENIGGNFLTVGGSVRWVNPDVSAEVLDQLRGPDLAGSAAAGLTITQPRSFPVPPDALREDGIDFGDHLYGSAMRNNQGQLVELSVGRRKGERDAHDSDVNRLSKCHDLFQLQCFGDFTDESLKTIGMLQELRTLRIASDSITDDGLLVLAELRMLTQLTISGRQITAEGIEALQKRMPECKIVRSRY